MKIFKKHNSFSFYENVLRKVVRTKTDKSNYSNANTLTVHFSLALFSTSIPRNPTSHNQYVAKTTLMISQNIF